jgi:hypothetical protein
MKDVGVRTYDPDTSHEAAGLMKLHVSYYETLVHSHLVSVGWQGATTAEIAHAIKVPLETVTPRMCPLERKAMIARTDERRVFPGKRVARIVWVAT